MHLELSFYQRNLAHLHYISTSMSDLKIEERESITRFHGKSGGGEGSGWRSPRASRSTVREDQGRSLSSPWRRRRRLGSRFEGEGHGVE